MSKLIFESLKEENLANAAEEILKEFELGIVLFEGEVGAGKTTLIKTICRHLGCRDDLSSPTFSLVNEYTYPGGFIYHFDLYRLENQKELLDIGFMDYLDSKHPCLIEWPELAMDYFIGKGTKIIIEPNHDNKTRNIICEEILWNE